MKVLRLRVSLASSIKWHHITSPNTLVTYAPGRMTPDVSIRSLLARVGEVKILASRHCVRCKEVIEERPAANVHIHLPGASSCKKSFCLPVSLAFP